MSKDEFLKENIPGTYELHPLTGDAGTRSYSRLKTAPKPYILCTYKSDELEHYNNYLDIQKLLFKQKVNIPQTYAQKSNFMLLEDLGDTTLESVFKKNPEKGEVIYSKTIDELIKIQSIPLKGASKAQSYCFTVEKFEWELNFALEHLSKLLSLKLDTQSIINLKKEFHNLSQVSLSLPEVITHRDFHSRNIMIHDQKPYIIDFQDARLGPPFYDLVSLLEDSYVDMSKDLKDKLIKQYCLKKNITLNSDFIENYHIQNIQRSLKACGSFASLKNLKNSDRYLPNLNAALTTLINSIKHVNQYPNIESFSEQVLKLWLSVQ